MCSETTLLWLLQYIPGVSEVKGMENDGILRSIEMLCSTPYLISITATHILSQTRMCAWSVIQLTASQHNNEAFVMRCTLSQFLYNYSAHREDGC